QRNSFAELPAPVSYTTDNLHLETGYRSEKIIFKLDGLISQFENDNEVLHWQTPFAGNAWQTTSLAPSNDYYKVGGSLMLRLPANTTFMARANHSIIENDLSLSFPYLGTPTNLNFGGKITYTTASTVVSSNPYKPLDLRFFYNHLTKSNDSDVPATYGVNTGSATATETEKFGYHKNNLGFDVGYRLPAKTKVAAGYEYLHLSRALRQDASNTTDHILFAEVKNSYLDALSAKLRYQYLTRSSDKIGKPPSAFDSFGRADAADKTQHAIKAGLDLEPLHDLSIGIEYAIKLDSYDDKYKFSLQDNERHEIYIDANYKIADVTLNGYFNYEHAQSKGNYLRGTASTDDSLDPSLYTSGVYPWSSKRVDKNFAYGVNASTDVIKDKANVSVGWRYEKANGNNDLHSDYNTL
ncbi:MAG TPA: MtrB/PioB family outer membrane beta-barrel protein, partial [Campylobacterales bacterium]|nr:MtrB/PioB family outer membrane beta-barrel protein [Campylobacterales bacterium]